MNILVTFLTLFFVQIIIGMIAVINDDSDSIDDDYYWKN